MSKQTVGSRQASPLLAFGAAATAVLAIAAAWLTTATAADKPKATEQRASEKGTGGVLSLRRLMQQLDEHHPGDLVIRDAVLDLDGGQLVALLVAPEKGEDMIVAPAACFTGWSEGDHSLKLDAKAWDAHSKFPVVRADHVPSRDAMAKAAALVGPQPKSDDPTPEHELALASACLGAKVANDSSTTLGAITDLALRRRDLGVQFAVLRTEAAKDKKAEQIAIPLGAFVVDPKVPAWTLELPPDILAARPRVEESPANWPSDIDLGWEEYVRVRYGTLLRGVRREKAESAK